MLEQKAKHKIELLIKTLEQLRNIQAKDAVRANMDLTKYDEIYIQRKQKLVEICQKYNLSSTQLDYGQFDSIVCFHQYQV